MDANKLMDALTGVKDKYLREADIFQPVPAEPAPHAPRLLAWAGGIAACAVTVLGLLLLGRLGLLSPLPSGQEGNPAAASSQAIAEDFTLPPGDERSCAEAAPDGEGLVPLEELPQLTFPTREEAGTVGTSIGCGGALTEEPLSLSGTAAIFGQQSPAWEGLSLAGDSPYSLSGKAEYNEDGTLSRVTLSLCQRQAGQPQDFLTVEISPGHIPALGTHLFSPSHTCDVWGTEVTTCAAYDDQQSSAQFALSFLTGKQGEEGVLGVAAECRMGQESPMTQETAQELLTRLASQCLRPGNIFTLAGLEQAGGQGPVPLEELPPIDFSAQGGTVSLDQPSSWGWNPEMGADGARLFSLTPDEIAGLWGMSQPFWEGQSAAELFDLAADAYRDKSGKLLFVNLLGYVPGKDGTEDLPLFCARLYPGGLPENSRKEDAPFAVSDVWGTQVRANRVTLDTAGAFPFYSGLYAEFLREGEEPIGVVVQGVAQQVGVQSDKGFLSQAELEGLVTRFISQCLRPGNTFTLAGLEDPYRVYIDKEGYLFTGGYSTFAASAYDAVLNSAAVLTGDDAVSNANDDSCVRVLTLHLPVQLVEQIEPAEGELNRELCALYSVDYGFFERDGEKVIEKIGGYGDVIGVITTPRGGAVKNTAWYPKDGPQYLPSIAEFIGGDESAAEQAVQQAHAWPEKAKSYAEALLASYLEQNLMDGWKMKTADGTLSPFGPQGDSLKAAAEEVARKYADSWLTMTEEGYPPLAECFYTDLNYSRSADPDSELQVSCKMVFRLEDPDGGLGNWAAGNTQKGTGEYQGYYTAFRFIYARQENGGWVITSSGTGP